MAKMQSLESASFPSFAGLPAELRQEIWKLAFPPPRIIQIHTARGEILFTNSKSTVTRRRKKFKHVYATKASVPTVLHVCQESRLVALRHYQLTFDSNPRPARASLLESTRSRGDEATFPFETAAMIYCDLSRDVIFLTNEQKLINFAAMPTSGSGLFENFVFTVTVPKHVLCQIKYLALSNMLWNGSARFLEMRNSLRALNGLKGLFILEAVRQSECMVSWNRRVGNILLKFPEEMQSRVMVLENEQILHAAIHRMK